MPQKRNVKHPLLIINARKYAVFNTSISYRLLFSSFNNPAYAYWLIAIISTPIPIWTCRPSTSSSREEGRRIRVVTLILTSTQSIDRMASSGRVVTVTTLYACVAVKVDAAAASTLSQPLLHLLLYATQYETLVVRWGE